MKLAILIITILTTLNLLSYQTMTEDIGISWGRSTSGIKTYIQKQLMKKYDNYNDATPEKQDIIVKKIKDDVKKILKNKVLFKERNNMYDNSIYAGEFNYNNNESMLTLMSNNKTTRFFMIKDHLWKLILIIEKDKLGKEYKLSNFINHFSKKYKLEPYKIEYDKFNIDKKIPIKAYFKDNDTLLSLTYDDIYGSFILVYSSIAIMKKLKEKGFKVIKSTDIDLKVDIGDEVKEYDQLLYETDYTSDNENEDTKDIFNEIDDDFKKGEKKSKEKRKKKKK